MSQRRQPKPPKPNRPRFAGLRSFFRGINRFIGNILSAIQRRLFVLGRDRPSATAGFVLPTVIMVVLVVTLLTLTIVFRSFDRSRNANNVRISQATLEAASPAVERATAKLDTLFSDPRLPRSTPSDSALYGLLGDPQNDEKFTFDDEVRVELAYDFGNGNGGNSDGGINTGGNILLERDEVINTAWKYPVDTDNNGLYDSFTIYSILFRTPEQENDGDLARERSPIESRTRPMDDGSGSGFCAAALNTSAKLVSQGGWYKSGSKLKKSFFVYTATVPITDTNQAGLITVNNGGDGNGNTNQQRPRLGSAKDRNNYEVKGNSGFTALEYQQDRSRIPLGNYAVVFEDDLAIVSGPALYLNGSIIANSNLFLSPGAGSSAGRVQLYQVSAPISCFYQEENSKVFVGGHLINSPPALASNQGSDTPVHLFKPDATPSTNQTLKGQNQSAVIGESPERTVYNSAAYTARINRLVDNWIAANADNGAQVFTATDPGDVQDAVRDFNGSPAEKSEKRQQALFNHFKNRMRKVPFDEEPQIDPTAMATLTGTYQGTGDDLRPQDTWIFPYNPNDGKNSGGYAQIDLNINGDKVRPPATEPRTLRQDGEENYIGDRIQVGNNLPAVWYKNNQPVGEDELQEITGTVWNKDDTPPTDTTRGRYTQVKILSDVGDKSRGGFWEVAAATQPENPLSGEGGLRIITGAGVYERKSSFLPPPPQTTYDDPSTTGITEQFPVVWPDTMPMSPVPGSKVYDNDPASPTYQQWVDLATATRTAPTGSIDSTTRKYAKGDLKMRASAVYHYAQDIYEDDNWQKPIACVSSYYDPSTEMSARNTNNLPNVSGDGGTQPGTTNDPIGSNNGVVYSYGFGSIAQAVGTWQTQLYAQADLVYPDGRFVNEQLHKAVKALRSGTLASSLSIASQAAIDSTVCALQILSNPTAGQNETFIKHGWIQEFAFLDPKEVKGNQAVADRASLTASRDVNSVGNDYTNASNDYNLPIEERQPSEVRVTAIDLDALRRKTIDFAGGVDSTSPSPEFLLPNSGIIYASRDDALPDISAASSNLATPSEIKDSAVDYKLDPTRRSRGIMVYNGLELGRAGANSFNTVTPGEAEKGLILVTNNPAYVWANETKSGGAPSAGNPYAFNAHTQEEFNAALNLDPNNPWTNFYTRGDNLGEENPNFACRQNDPRLTACTVGDEWRPATIVSDAIGFLSGDFRFGYRNEGDFDLRNNQDSYYEDNYDYTTPGSVSKEARKKRFFNGFLDNNYVTNGLSSFLNGSSDLAVRYNGTDRLPSDTDYSGNKTMTGQYVPSSYFNNFVTPVQRRIDYHEYLMEVCPKLPVSECGPNDWYVKYDVSTGNGTRSDELTLPIAFDATFNAGTTALPPAQALQRFPRRVAFQRNPGGQIALTPNGGKPTAIPLGIQNRNTIQPYPYSGTGSENANAPTTQNNALWFVSTFNTSVPWRKVDWRYNLNRLAYLNYKPAVETEELVLPDVLSPSLRDKLTGTDETVMNFVSNALNLNDPRLIPVNNAETPTTTYPYFTANDDPSDYTFCIGGTDATGHGRTRDFQFTGKLSGDCNAQLGSIEAARAQLTSLTPTGPNIDASTAQTLTADRPVNVYRINATDNILLGKTIELDKGNQVEPIFVFQAQGVKRLTFDAVTLNIKGVNPNNIFWVSDRGVAFNKANDNNLLAGNFLGGNVTSTTPEEDSNLDLNVGNDESANTTKIIGGRFLGFTGTIYVPDDPATTTVEPNQTIRSNDLSTIGKDASGDGGVEITTITSQYQPVLAPVLQIHTAQGTNYGKGNPNGDGELVEETKWRQIAAPSEYNIVFASGNSPARPGEADGGIANFATLLEGWDEVNYRINGSQMEFERASFSTSPYRPVIVSYNDNQSKGGPFNFNQTYKTGNGGGGIPYTGVPNRLFGYDVGLLSQTPDLFSSRFTAPSPGDPDEFFREVGRNDDWVQTLLCAKNAGTTQPAINSDQRPQNFCSQKTE